MTTILTKKKDTAGAPAPGDLTNSAGGAELAVNTATKRLYTKDSGGNIVEIGTNPSSVVAGSITDSGNLTFTGTGNRITGDFSNGTISNGVVIQTSTTNGATSLAVAPNGSSVISGFFAVSGLTANESLAQFRMVGGTDMRLNSTITGTGTYLPMTFYTGGSERMRVDTSGNVLVGTTSNTSTVGTAIRYGFDASSTIFVGKNNAPANANWMELAGGGATRAVLAWDTTGGGAWFGSTAAYPVSFYTNNTERMRIDSSGRLLIGTTSASGSNLLQVNSDALINGLTVGRGAGAVSSNSAFGNSALVSNTTGAFNSAFGQSALALNIAATRNSAFGYASLQVNDTGGYNSAFGMASMQTNSSGSFNTAMGVSALNSNTTASKNTAVGYQAGYSAVTSAGNTFIGYQAGYSHAGSAGEYSNTFVGYNSGFAATTGYTNTFIGYNAGSAVTTGLANVILGSYTGNSGGLDIRTASNYIVISDGVGNPRQVIDSSGNVNAASNMTVGSLTATAPLVGTGRYLTLYNTSNATLSIQAVDGTNDRNAVLELLSSGNGSSYSQILYGDTDTTPATPSPLLFLGYHSGTVTERMRLTATGNLGIGTTSPGVKLDVAGTTNIRHTYTGATGGILFGQYNTTGDAQIQNQSSSGVITLATNNTERMRIDSSGNVGIGTSSPNYKLQVKATTNQNFGIGGAVSLANAVALSAVNDANSANVPIEMRYATNFAWFDAGTERMRIDASGNVGIGTSSPSYQLDIYNSASAAGVNPVLGLKSKFNSYGQGPYLSFRIFDTNTSSDNNETARIAGLFTSGSNGAIVNGALTFYTGNGSAMPERMRIDSSGNLLVGKTTTDNATVGVSWSPTGAGTSVYAGGAGDGPQIQVVNTTASGTAPNGFRYLSFRLGATATEIGTITKASATTIAYNTSSDYRLKYNIAPMTGALEKVKQLKPCTYKWHEDDSDGEGFIAHELAEVCPFAVTGEKDAVNEDGSIKPQGIDTSFLVATLTAAIQEQQALITALTARITALESK